MEPLFEDLDKVLQGIAHYFYANFRIWISIIDQPFLWFLMEFYVLKELVNIIIECV